MIDLDALEQAAIEPQTGWQGEVWDVVDQPTLAALVRVVRAAQGIALLRGPQSVQETDLGYLREALAPFRKETA